jgi:hypothetical protein
MNKHTFTVRRNIGLDSRMAVETTDTVLSSTEVEG